MSISPPHKTSRWITNLPSCQLAVTTLYYSPRTGKQNQKTNETLTNEKHSQQVEQNQYFIFILDSYTTTTKKKILHSGGIVNDLNATWWHFFSAQHIYADIP